MHSIGSSLHTSCLVAAFIVLFSVGGVAQQSVPVPFNDATSGLTNVRPMSHETMIVPQATSTTTNTSCHSINFEGLGSLNAIPTFYGVSLPDWLSSVEKSQGGGGNFSNQPTPNTTAFWLNGNPTSQSIRIPNGASYISFYYASAYPITLTALDANGNQIATVSGSANYDYSTGSYDVWTPLTVTAPSGQFINTLNITGQANYTGIDELSVCQQPVIAGVEITQAIQQYQSLDQLKTSLANTEQPPVPVIAGKKTAVRIYFNPMQAVSPVTVKANGTAQTVHFSPMCQPEDQRSHNNGCDSIDYQFTPPPGAWNLTIDVFDSGGNQLDEQILNLTSISSIPIHLHAVSICDAKDSNGMPLCATAADLMNQVGLLRTLTPTSTVTVDIYSSTKDTSGFQNADPQNDPYFDGWWDETLRQVNALWGEDPADNAAGQKTAYFGVVRAAARQGINTVLNTQTSGISFTPSHAALARDGYPESIAHETGHTLGLYHTTTNQPQPPCGDISMGRDWPFPDNYLRSSATVFEAGYDPSTFAVKPPMTNYELMSYCTPRWISPLRYSNMNAVVSPNIKFGTKSNAMSSTVPPQAFWHVTGTLRGNQATFDPLFQYDTVNDTTSGVGTYSLQTLDGAGSSVFKRLFTLNSPPNETGDPSYVPSQSFDEWIPVVQGASAIVLTNPQGTELGRITLGGTVPTVTVTSPTAGAVMSGTQVVTWTVQGAATFSVEVLYSNDAGVSWTSVGNAQNANSLLVNYDNLPGSSRALIKVLASNGSVSGSGLSAVFSVTKKAVSHISIDSPLANYAQAASRSLYLSGAGYDIDDGVLSGTALQWTDNVAGNLGSGSPLIVTLSPGSHTITLTGTDSDGNSTSSQVTVRMAGDPPVVNLAVLALNTNPTTCSYATITASPGVNQGAALISADYSVDGGSTYTSIPLSQIPFGFLVPGSGFEHIVARAFDAAGQSNATDTTFFTQSACTLQTQTITFASLNNVSFGYSPIALRAIASSGLAVTYTVTGPATLSGTTLTVTGVGSVTVTAMQPGNSSYAPAPLASQTFAVNRATPTISWATPSGIGYGTSLQAALNAMASIGATSIPGNYAYTATISGASTAAVSGTSVLTPGIYTLGVTFTPTDAIDYASASGLVVLTVGKASPTLTLGASSNPVLIQTSVSLMATVSAPAGTPSGTVTFLDGATSLGSAPVTNGVASLSISALALGSHSFTAQYSGDTNFTTVTSSALSEAIEDFTLAAGTPATQTVKAGSAATYMLSIMPTGGNSFSVPITLSASGLPSDASATFSPATVTPGSAATTVTMTVQTTSADALLVPWRWLGSGAATVSLGVLFLPFGRRLRTQGRRLAGVLWLSLALVAAGLLTATIAGCGGNSKSANYTVTVTATAGVDSHKTTVMLTVD